MTAPIRFFSRSATLAFALLSPLSALGQQPSTPVAPIAEVKPGSAIPIRYKLAKPGKVSINIYDAKGAIAREVLNIAERPAGDNLEVWDGLDSKRQPLPPGKYSWKLLATPGLKAEYLLSVGSNYAIRPNANWNSLAPGSIGGPSYVYADATGMYIGAASENIEPALIKQSLDGKTRFWERGLGPYNAPRGQAQIGAVLWLFVGGLKTILPLDPATGADTKNVNAISTSWTLDNAESNGDWMAGLDGLLALAYTKNNAIRWIDPASGKVTATTTMKAPTALASGNGVLYATDGKTVFTLTKEAAEPIEWVSGLKSVRCMTVDAATGDLLLFDGGQTGGGDSQIKRFSKDGKLLRTYGQPGGRKDGLYTRQNQESFRTLAYLSTMPDGGFVVAEDFSAPRRTAVFDKDGKWQREWYGGQIWAPWILPEPDNPNAVWMGSDWNGCSRLLVDYKTKTWKVHSTYSYASLPLSEGHYGIGTGMQSAAVHNGVLYLHRNGLVFKVDRTAGTWKAAAMVTGELRHEINIHFGMLPPAIQQAVDLHRSRKYQNESYALTALRWADSNDDGQMQSSEANWLLFKGLYHDNVRGPYLSWWKDKNGDNEVQADELKDDGAYMPPGNLTMDDQLNIYSSYAKAGNLLSLPAVWAANGSLAYETKPKSQSMSDLPEMLAKNINQEFLTRDEQTSDYYIAVNDPAGWGASKNSSMIKLGPDGSFKWSVGSIGYNPGQIRNFRGIFGVVKHCVAAPNTSNEWPSDRLSPTFVWDKDGLYVGGLLDNPVVNDSIPVWRYALGAESMFGKVWEDPKTGEVLFMSHWVNEGRIYRITGWDNWERQTGTLEIGNKAGTGGNGGLASFNKADGTRVGQWTMANLDFDPNKELKSQAARAIAQSGQYLLRLSGEIAAPADGMYTFSTRGGGATRLLIDGRIVLDSSLTPEQNALAQNPIEMKANQHRMLQLEYSPAAAQAGRIELLWNIEGQESAPIPQSALFAQIDPWAEVPMGKGVGLRGKYYGTKDNTPNVLLFERVENPVLDFGIYGKERPPLTMAAYWTGFIEPLRSGWTRVKVEGGGSHAEIDGNQMNDSMIFLEAGKHYPIKLSYIDSGIHPIFSHGVTLQWMQAGNRYWQVVPQSQLYPATE